jgi:acyl carrier protein
MTLDFVISTVTQFVTRTRGQPKQPIGPDTKLFQEGYVDSFGLFELRADLEAAAGATIAEGDLMPDDFETPRVLFSRLQEIAA